MAVSHPHPNQQRLVAQPAALSATGIRFLGHPAPAGNRAFLTVGLPAATRPDPNGVVVLHMSKLRPGRALSSSRGRWCAPGRRLPSGRDPPLFHGQSLTAPLEHPIGGGHFHETSARVHAIHPSPQARLATGPRPGTPPAGSRRSSPRPRPPDGTRAASASAPGSHPRLPTTHARAETGHHALARVLHPRPQPGLQRCLRLELMHPHVARSRGTSTRAVLTIPGTPGDPSAR